MDAIESLFVIDDPDLEAKLHLLGEIWAIDAEATIDRPCRQEIDLHAATVSKAGDVFQL